MTGNWFDTVVRAMVEARTRRAMLSTLVSGVTIGVLFRGTSVSADEDVLAEACRGKGAKCRKAGQCCSGRCKKHGGKSKSKNKKKGKCRCSPYLAPCSKDSDCCPFDSPMPLVCASGTCQT